MARANEQESGHSARAIGQNRLELLLFRLSGEQRYGINVFKVQEVAPCPQLIHMAISHPNVRGLANMRGKVVPVIDLGLAVGRGAGPAEGGYLVMAEYNRTVQGFLVGGVDRIVSLEWTDVLPPPQDLSESGYLTGVTTVDGGLVQIIDVEKVLAEVNATEAELSESVLEAGRHGQDENRQVLVVDDSALARRQILKTLAQLGIECAVAGNGREALSLLSTWVAEGCLNERVDLVLSDVEMPFMDGYTLTTEIRRHEALRHLPVILHTSLSGTFNAALVERAGANQFIAKFDPDALAQGVNKGLETARQYS
ncbi:MAG TPA: chemotaxis protein [Porticoccaceae bacterium]|nr:chemotaxis protein [Porticoccaceae bacterium]